MFSYIEIILDDNWNIGISIKSIKSAFERKKMIQDANYIFFSLNKNIMMYD